MWESCKIKDTDKILTVLGMILSKNLDKQCKGSDSCMIVKDHTRNMRDSCLTYVVILQDHVAKICFNFLTQSCKIHGRWYHGSCKICGKSLGKSWKGFLIGFRTHCGRCKSPCRFAVIQRSPAFRYIIESLHEPLVSTLP